MSWGRRGLGVAQVFIFILAAVSFALIMIFGYKAISSFVSSGEGVQLVQFKTDLESSIKKIYTEYGSVREERYKLPSEFQQICFVNLEYSAPKGKMDQLIASLKKENFQAGVALKDAYDASGGKDPGLGYEKVDENVFLAPLRQGLTQIKVYRISIGNYSYPEGEELPYLCIKVNGGTFSLMLEGKGDRTKIYHKS
ncbi:MAG: hypothetical protein V2A62_05665 [Candidatus Woesearchaeota archaeon]